MQKLTDILPANSYFTEIGFEYLSPEEGSKITLKGFVPDSDALRRLRDNLEADSNIYKVETPGMNPENFSITIKFEI